MRQWRDSELPVVARRMLTKAEHVRVLDEERERRVAAMSTEERQRYEARKIAYAPGPAEARAVRKLMAAYQSTAAPSLQDLTVQEIEAMIAELKAQRASRQHQGVFG